MTKRTQELCRGYQKHLLNGSAASHDLSYQTPRSEREESRLKCGISQAILSKAHKRYATSNTDTLDQYESHKKEVSQKLIYWLDFTSVRKSCWYKKYDRDSRKLKLVGHFSGKKYRGEPLPHSPAPLKSEWLCQRGMFHTH